MNGQEAEKSRILQTFADLITLVYHEGRNVRHLVKAKRIEEPHRYSGLTSLPAKREKAWRVLQKQRDAAKAKKDATQVEEVYSRRFGRALEEMKPLSRARDSGAFGGNKWAAITELVILLRDALVDGRIEEADQVAQRTLRMCHNTGRVIEKLKDLDDAIRTKVLFVCSGNSERSPTAERMFDSWKGMWETKSAGIDRSACHPIEKEDVDWADLVLVMQPVHKEHICEHRKWCNPDKVKILDIEDKYAREHPELINQLHRKVPPILEEWAERLTGAEPD
jgi:predicted protein tyrosine phosphatase